MIELRALFAWLGIGALWDTFCERDKTLSAAAARLLVDKRTRWPMIGTMAWVVLHLVVMARAIARAEAAVPHIPVDTTPYAVLRNCSWPA